MRRKFCASPFFSSGIFPYITTKRSLSNARLTASIPFCNLFCHAKLRAEGLVMTHPIKKTVVLGAGTMGARIAAHFANAGLPCLLLDIVPKDAVPGERNKIVAAGLEAAKKSKPAAFFATG